MITSRIIFTFSRVKTGSLHKYNSLSIKNRIKDKFYEVSKDPFRYLKHYGGNYYKLRIGDFRALIDIDFNNKTLFVRVFDKRGRIYK